MSNRINGDKFHLPKLKVGNLANPKLHNSRRVPFTTRANYRSLSLFRGVTTWVLITFFMILKPLLVLYVWSSEGLPRYSKPGFRSVHIKWTALGLFAQTNRFRGYSDFTQSGLVFGIAGSILKSCLIHYCNSTQFFFF